MQVIHNHVILLIGSILVATFMSLAFWIYTLKTDLKVEKLEREGIEAALTAQSTLIESNRVEYEENLENANKTNVVIKNRYVDKIKVIEKWRDANVSCQDAMFSVDNYSY